MFGTHEPQVTHDVMGGVQHKFKFDNGYGASVLRHMGSYGSEQGLWELAVLDAAGGLTYDTPVTDDVLGYLTDAAVVAALDQIAALPATATGAAFVTYDYERGCSHVAVTVIPHEPIAVTEGGALRFGPVLVMPEGNTAAERADWLDDLAGKCRGAGC